VNKTRNNKLEVWVWLTCAVVGGVEMTDELLGAVEVVEGIDGVVDVVEGALKGVKLRHIRSKQRYVHKDVGES
jgi:hypothetical protein